ncbi:MAG: CheR family methyltransferase [Candidatus Acidiferrales bacterium]|jgi:chemotaxis protein methyltransferase WspC
MVHTDIEELLSARLGFDIETIGAGAVATMVKRAMEHAGFSDPKAYAWFIRHDPEAWERFVDHVVVGETWFFRDVGPFELAADLIRGHSVAGTKRPVRILSCPCSTGEEPYSLVLSILHTGAPPGSFLVDAVDISRRSLKTARAGVYSTRSFRGSFPWDRETHFDRGESETEWRVSEMARSCVRFRQGNIASPDFLTGEPPYDIVFCRNLLIYLHMEARLLAMAALRRLVAENGVLVLGHAETPFAREHGFKPRGPAGAFAFVKCSEAATPKLGVPESRNSNVSVPRTPLQTSSLKPVSSVANVNLSASVKPLPDAGLKPQVPAPSLLEVASQLGDSGQLHSALQTCSEYLQEVPGSAEGYFLLGVLHDALGHTDLAVNSFKKVLYLDPNHLEALLCLALKQEARGDSSAAELLRARARRLQQADKASNV